MVFPPSIHSSDAPQLQQQQSAQAPPTTTVVNVSETSRRQQIVASSPVKSHPLHNFPLSGLRWAMNHTNTHRLRKPSGRSPLREADLGIDARKGTLVVEELNGASASSSEMKPEMKKKGNEAGLTDSTVDRSRMKSTTTADRRSKIFIRIRQKSNEESIAVDDTSSAVAAPSSVSETDVTTGIAAPSLVHVNDDVAGQTIKADASLCERISDEGQEAEEFGPKTWNLRPRKPPSTKKRSIGNNSGLLKSCSGSGMEIKGQGTVRTESIRSRNGADAKISAEKKEKKPRLSISLSKMEIDEDIYALTGSKPSRRPKKRAKNVQKQLDVLFPGLWMGNVSSDAYKVSDHA